jgi:hypothetical protein
MNNQVNELAEETLFLTGVARPTDGYASKWTKLLLLGQSTSNYYWLDKSYCKKLPYNFTAGCLHSFLRCILVSRQACFIQKGSLIFKLHVRPTFYKCSLRYTYPFEGSLQPLIGLDYEVFIEITSHTCATLVSC